MNDNNTNGQFNDSLPIPSHRRKKKEKMKKEKKKREHDKKTFA
jgi:hypothetical protein